MIDESVKAMVRRLEGGDLQALVPLLDRLEERGDERHADLFAAAGNLVRASRSDFYVTLKANARISREELVFRQDEGKFRIWAQFVDGLRLHFWAELAGDSMAGIVKVAEVVINPAKHAERLAKMGTGDEGADAEDTGPQEMGYAMPSGPRGRRRGW